MGDINLGDTHLIALDDCTTDNEEASCDQYVALVVAQRRNNFDLRALGSGESTSTIVYEIDLNCLH